MSSAIASRLETSQPEDAHLRPTMLPGEFFPACANELTLSGIPVVKPEGTQVRIKHRLNGRLLIETTDHHFRWVASDFIFQVKTH